MKSNFVGFITALKNCQRYAGGKLGVRQAMHHVGRIYVHGYSVGTRRDFIMANRDSTHSLTHRMNSRSPALDTKDN